MKRVFSSSVSRKCQQMQLQKSEQSDLIRSLFTQLMNFKTEKALACKRDDQSASDQSVSFMCSDLISHSGLVLKSADLSLCLYFHP